MFNADKYDETTGHYAGNLYLRGYSHPLPAGLASVGGNLYLSGYTHPLPVGLASVGGNLYLSGYSHPLPAGLAGDITIPIIPEIDAQILAAIENGGTLEMGDWHTCDTTHCRAGWAIHLAGENGRLLELRVGSAAAGALIYQASRGSYPDFYALNEAAMADLRQCAGKA